MHPGKRTRKPTPAEGNLGSVGSGKRCSRKRTGAVSRKTISEKDSLEARRREAASIKTARQEEYARKREAEAAAQKAEQERLLKEYEKRKNQIANYTDEELMQEAARAAGEFVHVDQRVMQFLLPGIPEEKINSIVQQLADLHILTETPRQGRYLCRMDRKEIERILGVTCRKQKTFLMQIHRMSLPR